VFRYCGQLLRLWNTTRAANQQPPKKEGSDKRLATAPSAGCSRIE
jgi:hypothetical protein